MTKTDIKSIIEDLRDKYENEVADGDYTTAIDIHDEITRWMRELKEWKL